MALPGVKTTMKDKWCGPAKPEYVREEIETVEKQKSELLKGRFEVSIGKTHSEAAKLVAIEKKIEEIISHPEYTHLQLWNEVKALWEMTYKNYRENTPKTR